MLRNNADAHISSLGYLWFVQIVTAILRQNLPVLNFAYHLPKLSTDRFAI